jgi:hypothetical protein
VGHFFDLSENDLHEVPEVIFSDKVDNNLEHIVAIVLFLKFSSENGLNVVFKFPQRTTVN